MAIAIDASTHFEDNEGELIAGLKCYSEVETDPNPELQNLYLQEIDEEKKSSQLRSNLS